MRPFSDSTFICDAYQFDIETGALELSYQLDDHTYTERFTFPVADARWSLLSESELTDAIFALHLACGVSYWKATCAKHIEVRSGELTPEQAAFWNTIYTVGMGEFHYTNQIDFRNQAPFQATIDTRQAPETHEGTGKILVPIGGGKDSIVTAELLNTAGLPFTCFSIDTAPPIEASITLTGKPHLRCTRTFDRTLAQHPHALNGHVPITLIWSLASVITALLHAQQDVIFSWEASASEGSVQYLDTEINHQYSKSLAFERALQTYLSTFVTKRVRVFSILRPWTEFRIMRAFSHLPAYHPVFSSCNRNFRQTTRDAQTPTFWCNRCPKCAFVFALLDAWLPHAEVVTLFKEDLFRQPELLQTYRDLLGIGTQKPFECVGEAQEVAAALACVAQRQEALDTPVMQLFTQEVAPTFTDPEQRIAELLELRPDHAIPEDRFSLSQGDL